jgi:hypothetical protein
VEPTGRAAEYVGRGRERAGVEAPPARVRAEYPHTGGRVGPLDRVERETLPALDICD